jgi:hypothetical protein
MLSLLSTIYNLLDVNKMKKELKPLYVKNPKTSSTLYMFLKNCWNDREFCRTYYDVECKREQRSGMMRSFGDLLRICKGHFPDTTPKQLAEVIIALNKKCQLTTSYCYTVRKNVFWKWNTNYGHTPNLFIGNNIDRVGADGWSLQQILEL